MSGEMNETEKTGVPGQEAGQTDGTVVNPSEQKAVDGFPATPPVVPAPRIPGHETAPSAIDHPFGDDSNGATGGSVFEEKVIVSEPDIDGDVPPVTEGVSATVDDVPASFPSFLREGVTDEPPVETDVLVKAAEEDAADTTWETVDTAVTEPTSFPSFLREGIVEDSPEKPAVQAPIPPLTGDVETVAENTSASANVGEDVSSSVVSGNAVDTPVNAETGTAFDPDHGYTAPEQRTEADVDSRESDTVSDTEMVESDAVNSEERVDETGSAVENEMPKIVVGMAPAPIVPPVVIDAADTVSETTAPPPAIDITEMEEIIATPEVSNKPGPGYQTTNKAKPPVAKDIETLKLETVEDEEAMTPEEALIHPVLQAEAPADTTEKAPVDYKSADFLKELFANDNECITAPDGSFPVQENIRQLLALFSNGRFFVAENAKFDGRVLGLEYKARKRRLQVGKPEYVPTIVLNDIYEYVARSKSATPVVETENQEQARMQRDFVTIVSRAAMGRVSDIHIVVADHTTVMFRVNGLMQTEMEYNKEWGESFVRAAFASSDISDSNYAQNEYQAAQKLGRTPLRGSNGRLILPRNVLGIRLQFNPIAFGSRYVVMRLLYAEENSDSASDLEVLGFTKHESELFYQLRAVPTGIVVISGPTGSGKSTTLQRNMIAMLQERNYEINLITVEDPPEYPIPGARQMPVTNASIEEAKDREFTKALSAALRSDPDSLMIGEVRTLSAADLAFRGALSGHNVWTTLHANSAPAVLMRLKDMGVEDFKLQDPEIMKGMLAQRLFRKVCPYCRVPATARLDHPAVQRLRRAFGDIGLSHAFLRGAGCKECDFRGVKGRTVVGEFILPDATFLDLMIRGESKKAMNYWINDLNGRTLRDGALARMLDGVIDIEEVERWTGFLDQQMIS